MTSGIYKLETRPGRFYVGSSQNIEQRCRYHLTRLRNGRHTNAKLQASFDKNGGASWEVLDECDPVELLQREQRAIDELSPPLNLSRVAGKVEQTPEVRAKIGRALRKRVKLVCQSCGKTFAVKPCWSWRKYCSQRCAWDGNKKPCSTERREKISAVKKGRSNGLEGRPVPAATRAKIAAALTGRPHSPERIENIRKARHDKRSD